MIRTDKVAPTLLVSDDHTTSTARTYEVAMSSYDISLVLWYVYKMTYPDDDRDPDVSTHE
jgi:hypothetical protein